MCICAYTAGPENIAVRPKAERVSKLHSDATLEPASVAMCQQAAWQNLLKQLGFECGVPCRLATGHSWALQQLANHANHTGQA